MADARQTTVRTMVLALIAFVVVGGLWRGLTWYRGAQLVASAKAALAAEDLETAQSRLREALAFRPNDAEILFLAARTARQSERYEEAAGFLARATVLLRILPLPELDPAFELLLLRAHWGDNVGLKSRLDAIRRQQPERAAAIVDALIYGEIATRRAVGASPYFDEAFARMPDHPRLHMVLARQLAKIGNASTALVHGEKAVEQLPSSVEARILRGELYLELGRVREALRDFATVRTRDPDHVKALIGEAHARALLGDSERALALLQRATESHPAFLNAWVELAWQAYHCGDWERAEAAARKAELLAPNSVEALDVLAASLDALGKTAESQQATKKKTDVEIVLGQLQAKMNWAVEHARADPEPCLQIADGFMRLGQEADAVEWYFCAIQRQPRPAGTHRTLADYFDRTGQSARAAIHRDLAEE